MSVQSVPSKFEVLKFVNVTVLFELMVAVSHQVPYLDLTD